LVAALLLGGCASVQPISPATYQSAATTSEHKIETSYELGVPVEVYVGERMLRIQDYYYATIRETETIPPRLIPTESFTMKIPPFMSVTVTPQNIIPVTGTTERDGELFRLVALPGAPTASLRFLVTSDGAFEGSALNMVNARMGWSYRPTPETVRLVPVPEPSSYTTTRIDTSKGFTNYELVYSGTSRDSFQLLYREYTQNDLARPAFSQTLVYEKGSESIRFRNLQIQVHEASNDRIRFTVVSDSDARKITR